MRPLFWIAIVAATSAADRTDSEPARERALFRILLKDASGTETELFALARALGPERFVGWLGSAEIEVPFERLASIDVNPAPKRGERARARLTLRSGKVVDATFDEREGDSVLKGFAWFGEVSFAFRDARRIEFREPVGRSGLPEFGPKDAGVDAAVTDREGIQTEVVGFRRAVGPNLLSGARGATRVEVPLRRVERIDLAGGAVRVGFAGGGRLDLSLAPGDRDAVFTAEAEFGEYRIRLGDLLALRVHRVTPRLRDLDPVAAAEGEEREEGEAPR